jgi:hypothetical protein
MTLDEFKEAVDDLVKKGYGKKQLFVLLMKKVIIIQMFFILLL